MREPINENAFPFTIAFVCSGLCFLFLNFIADLLSNNQFPPVFRWMSFVCLLIGSIIPLFSLLVRKFSFKASH